MKHSLLMLFILALAFHHKGEGQCLSVNLIKNPGLEEYYQCPYWMAQIHQAKYWTQPLPLSTSDYFNTCYLDSITDWSILLFFEHSYFGNGYAAVVSG